MESTKGFILDRQTKLCLYVIWYVVSWMWKTVSHPKKLLLLDDDDDWFWFLRSPASNVAVLWGVDRQPPIHEEMNSMTEIIRHHDFVMESVTIHFESMNM
jgi:hypothetical protein